MTLQYHYSLELLPLVWIAALHGLMHAPSWVRRPSGSVGCIGRLPRQSAISIPRTVGSLGILPDRWRWQPEYGSVLWLALCGVIAFAIASPFPPARLFMPKRFVDTPAHTRAVTPALALIPPDAAVSAQTGLASHLSHREHLAQFPDLNGAQYVLLDASDDVARSEPEAQAAAMSALPVQGYRLIYSANGVAVYEKVPDR